MPVHRIPGAGIPTVWADPGELGRWLRNADPEPVPTVTVSAVPAASLVASNDVTLARRWRFNAALIFLAISAVGIAEGLRLGGEAEASHAVPPTLSAAGPYDDDSDARGRYLNAQFELGTRSAQGITAAIGDFEALTRRFPARAAAYSGLADAHVLSREFAAVPDAVAYPEAAKAARAALALDPTMADAWLNRAYVDFWWQHDTTAGMLAFQRALKLAPTSAKAHHWYATALQATGATNGARAEIRRARELDPNNHAIVADAAFVELCAGRTDDSIAALQAMIHVDPGMISAHRYLALAYLITGRDAEYLREAATVANLRGQAEQRDLQLRAAAAWASGGRPAMLDLLSTAAAEAASRGRGSWIEVMGYRSLRSDWAGAAHWLTVARQRHEPDLVFMVGDPMLAGWYQHNRMSMSQPALRLASTAD